MTVDLVDHRQKIIRPLALTPMDFVHAHRPDLCQFPVRQAPLHKPFHRTINTFPTRAKGPRGLAPRQPPGPPRKKTHHGRRHRPLALAPGHMFHHHPMLRALDPPGAIDEPRHQAPQRHKQPRAGRQLVITGRRFETPRALGGNPRVRQNDDLQVAGPARWLVHPDILKNKAGKMLQAVQNGFNFQLHRWSLVRWFAFLFNSQTKRSRRDQRCLFYQPHPTRRLDLKRATGRAFEPLARARWRSNVSAHLTGTPLLPTNHATDP